VIVDEDTPRCNMATDIAALVADKAFDNLDAPVPYGKPLEDTLVASPEDVLAARVALLGGRIQSFSVWGPSRDPSPAGRGLG
jgi:pyruvate/2-oxoglutarate/acetoin dehydrogenase E1 component